MKRIPVPASVLEQHIAALGKTGSGKTSTEKLIVEQVVADGFRVCVLDTIKSDWWGITSSADGKRPGLPFRILGGPRGHVPLHSSAGRAIGQLVGSGKLPLSIIDMADFEPGGIQRFFSDFAQALMKSARGVLYLVIEEAHEVAPKERVGFGHENMAIHWAKKLATAGRSKGIRLIVGTQAVQQLHNRVLDSCETIIAHRLTTPASQKPVVDWLKANVDKATMAEVATSLSSLPTGTGWVCSGEAKVFQREAFPKFSTFDNNATPTNDAAEITVKTAPVDADELRAIIGDAVIEAEKDDPKALRARIAELEKKVAEPKPEKVLAIDHDAVRAAEQAAHHDGRQQGFLEGAGHARASLSAAFVNFEVAVAILSDAINNQPEMPTPGMEDRAAALATHPRAPWLSPPPSAHRAPATHRDTPGEVRATMPRAFLVALAQHPKGLTKGQVLTHTGYRSSGSTSTAFAELARKDWIWSLGAGRLQITEAGQKALGSYEPLPVGSALRDKLLTGSQLSQMEKAVCRVLFENYPTPIAKGEILKTTGYKSSGSTSTAFAHLVAYGYAQRHGAGALVAAPELYE